MDMGSQERRFHFLGVLIRVCKMGRASKSAPLLLAAVCLCAIVPADAFIRVSEGKFVDEECREFVFVGANM